jgi:two-component system sensor histidine kinase VicK
VQLTNTGKYFLLLFIISTGIFSCKEKEVQHGYTPEFTAMYDEALIIHDAGDPTGSLRYFDSSYRTLSSPSVLDQYRFYEYFYNIYRRTFHDNNRALRYADSMILVFGDKKDLDYMESISHSYSSKGDALLLLGQYEEAYDNYYQAKVYAGASKNSCAVSDHDYRLGMVLYKQENYKRSAEYFKEAIKNAEGCELNFISFYRKQEILDNIALCYQKDGGDDSALLYFNKALDYINRSAPSFPKSKESLLEQARAIVYGNMAATYHRMGKNAEAEQLLKKSIAISSQPNHDQQDAKISMLKLADYYLDDNKDAEAKLILDEIKKISDTLYNETLVLNFRKTMVKYYERQGNTKEALAYLTAYTNLKELVDDKKKELIETDINGRLEGFKKEQEINLLAESNKRKQEYLVLLVVGALMTVAIGILVIRNWRRSREHVALLSKLNKHVKEQNLKLEDTLSALAKSNKEKDRILRAVSHDIRNPILAVSSLSELMQIDIENFPEEHREYVLLIQEACTHALNISNDLIEISSSKQIADLEKEYTDLNAILKSCINLLHFRADQKKLKLTLEQQHIGTLDIYANKEKMMRVINNIITNAIKFTPEGGLITVTAKAHEKEAIITIKDNGIGIPEEYHERIFDTFTEAKRPGTEGETPFGLGLSISKQIIEAHNGRIWFESIEDTGTTFYVAIPL